MNLQKELFEARNYHISLHVEYTQLKNAYERQVNVTEDVWKVVEKFGLSDPVNKVISKFWEDIEFITTAFFDILELLSRKEYLEKSILSIWKSQLVQVKEKESPHEEVVPSSDDGIAVVPGYLEYLNSQLVELKGRIKWVEFNLMKYKFAAAHGPQLKSGIDNVVKSCKKYNKWPKFPRSRRNQNKLQEEVEWYRKRLKFFRDDVQRIRSVHQAIYEKYLTPEDQKQFPSKTLSLENRLKGNPTNYPGSWIEPSRHSGLSTNLSGHSSSSANTVLPWTISMAGPSRLDCPSVLNTNQVESVEHRQETKVEADAPTEKPDDPAIKSNLDDCNISGKFIDINSSLKRECSASKSQSSYSDHDKLRPLDGVSSVSQSYGDGERKYSAESRLRTSSCVTNDNSSKLTDETSKVDVVKRPLDDRNPFLKDEASKTERISLKASNSSNPFEEEECSSGVNPKLEPGSEGIKVVGESCSEKSSSRQPSSESSYESAEEVLSGTAAVGPADEASKAVSQQAVPVNISNRPRCSTLSQLTPSVYLPCSIPLYNDGSSAMRHVNTFTATTNVPEIVNNYELLFLHETQKPPRSVLKKLFGKKK